MLRTYWIDLQFTDGKVITHKVFAINVITSVNVNMLGFRTQADKIGKAGIY